MADVEFKTIGDLEQFDRGSVAAMFAAAHKAAIEDCRQRPTVKTARKTVVSVSYIPVASDEGVLMDVRTEVEVKSTMPVGRTRQISAGALGDEGLVYSEFSPTNRQQQTLPLDQADES